jgi:aminoglycoside 3-N-acetyltransferase
MTEADAISASARPATSTSLMADVRSLGIDNGDVVIAHVSLSRLGWVVGGAQAVVEALLATVGSRGTLVMPTQSMHLSDPTRWVDPPVPPAWIDVVRAEMPVFDGALTPTRSMGQVVECFRHHRATSRSAHPTLSFAACGADAAAIVADHPLSPGLGEPSPLGRLYERDAKVVLLGVDHANNTSLHLAEHRAQWPSKTTRAEGAAVLVDGVRRWISYEDLDLDESDFAAIGDAFAETGGEQRGPVGAGIGRLCKMRDIVDFAATHMTTHRR